jgi:hypothetical protein
MKRVPVEQETEVLTGNKTIAMSICNLLYGRSVWMKMEQSDWFSEWSESCSPDQVTGLKSKTIFPTIIINILLTKLVQSR